MSRNAVDYFENTIIPLIQAYFPDLLPEMDIMLLGSVGLGIDDEISDIEAAIYLEDSKWKAHGKGLQLLLNDCLARTNKWKSKGSILCVHPVSWLLDGHSNKFLLNNDNYIDNLPWEKVSFETLFTIQNNKIILSNKGILKALREKTVSDKYPQKLWKKMLITNLKELINGEFFELKKDVYRNLTAEAIIIYGIILERIYHVAFLISHEYYPWRTHLDWAFRKLPVSGTELGRYIDKLLVIDNWNERLGMINTIIEFYKSYITNNKIVPEIDLYSDDNELIWAERLSAWNNPEWRNYIKEKEKDAVENGYNADQFWVFSLWS